MNVFKGERNPFLQDPVVQCLFEYLPFQDIKNCRFICTTWRFVSELFLRKRGTVVFLATFRPASFIEYTECNLPAVPFTSFKFTDFDKLTHPDSKWTVSEIRNFLAIYGRNIKILEFDGLTVFENEFHGGRIDVLKSEMNEFIDLAPNIVDLKIVGLSLTFCVVSVYKLVSVKNIYLVHCTLDLISNKDRITPLKIYLHQMKFRIDGVEVNEVSLLLHDFIDFSQCAKIKYHPELVKLTFDMSSIVTVSKLDINWPIFLNWSTSRAKIDHLILHNLRDEIENVTEMQIKKLTLENSKFRYLLPHTIEQLTLVEVRFCRTLVDLPNLTQLELYSKYYSGRDFSGIKFFKYCSKLKNLIVEARHTYVRKPSTFKIKWIPQSVKAIKLTSLQHFSFIFDAVIDVDILELDIGKISDAQNLINNIRPKILVCSEIQKMHCDDFIEFVQKNKQIEKILLGFHNFRDNFGLVVNNDPDFEKINFSHYVDKEAGMYEFENGRGTAISDEQFQRVRNWC